MFFSQAAVNRLIDAEILTAQPSCDRRYKDAHPVVGKADAHRIGTCIHLPRDGPFMNDSSQVSF